MSDVLSYLRSQLTLFWGDLQSRGDVMDSLPPQGEAQFFGYFPAFGISGLFGEAAVLDGALDSVVVRANATFFNVVEAGTEHPAQFFLPYLVLRSADSSDKGTQMHYTYVWLAGEGVEVRRVPLQDGSNRALLLVECEIAEALMEEDDEDAH